jgi:hypothetical protein
MCSTGLELINNWNGYCIVPGEYFWGNRELGPMVANIEDIQAYDIIGVTESGD